MLRRSIRVCEDCGTERRITLLEQAVTTSDGQIVTGLFGEGRCLCPSYALDELDLEALEDERTESAKSEESEELDVENADAPDERLNEFFESAPAIDTNPPVPDKKKPRPKR